MQHIEETANMLKLLGDKTRLMILAILSETDCCVCELVEMLQMSQPAISQHLRKLKDNDLVKETKKAQWVFYSLNKQHEFYPMMKCIFAYLPDPKEHIRQLEKKGMRIRCE
ncbi:MULTISPECIES: metalloregulator ArsR/SmtB family transcription factor [Anoxybacillus]|uniref:HTH-type transcriptional repressor AseR n=1 Tax=Anoxybacillus ayderensis TaxID=265546 RepID=A0A0D0G521_9BACL|nr:MULTISPECIES: metalloregulator ArsR/SmtB family transcription factor [Anoxybacillus]EPZ38260.1 ArsR family transcriptional regulator [Anoxybacillus ayderensis]KIP20400.1 HTH-type transcriptional repressor AseR [Anoxybacillus ayderensis]MBA2878138.1 ArsR family transcriptional regulator [Anoxybacillus ayderensis]MED0657941.1 metalloregulator ArsR/SmtB family transcription factor [Anoxybacillus ayderensis]MED0685467.1 metalloregulator ArsR/SmtB family transcription factor [Anoxybacillus ayder